MQYSPLPYGNDPGNSPQDAPPVKRDNTGAPIQPKRTMGRRPLLGALAAASAALVVGSARRFLPRDEDGPFATEAFRGEPLQSGDSWLPEISGAVWTDDGVWVHSDVRHPTAIILLGAPGTSNAGQALREIDLAGKTPNPVLDPEDITVTNDGHLILADTGDNRNNGGRDFMQLIRVNPETEEVVSASTYTFPNRGGQIEAILFDPIDEVTYLFAQDRKSSIYEGIVGPSRIFTAPLQASANTPTDLEESDLLLDLVEATAASTAELESGRVGRPRGLVTAADISDDGKIIAIRTYDTAFIFERSEGQTVAEALQGTPEEIPVVPEGQGEAFALNRGGGEFAAVTLSERNLAFNVIAR